MILLALCAIAIVVGVLELGPPAGASTRDRIVTAQKGVVQSTVSGSGTLQPTTTTNVNFRASGQLSHVYVSQGQSVGSGQVLADLDAASAQAAVDVAQANLTSANAKLDQARSEPISSTASTTSQQTTAAIATAARTPPTSNTQSGSQQTTGSQRQTSSTPATQSSGGQSSSGQGTGGGVSAAQAAADVASAQAAVESAQVNLDAARRTLAETKLLAPASGVVTSLNGQVGDTVGTGGGSSSGGSSSGGSSSGAGTNGSSSSSSSAAGGSGAAGAAGASGSTRGGSSASSGSGSSTGSSGGGSAFVVISDIGHLRLQVPLSESDIHRVQVNQSASVTVNALPGEKLAAHVAAIDDMPTTNNGVVSYTVTLGLDQSETGLKPGMTASAQVVVSQIDGVVTVPSSAISRRGLASTVTVVRGGKKSVQPVVTGITGDSTIQIISGLAPGQQVAIAIPTGSSRSAAAGGPGGGGGFRGLGGGLGGGGGGFGGGGGGFRRAAGPG